MDANERYEIRYPAMEEIAEVVHQQDPYGLLAVATLPTSTLLLQSGLQAELAVLHAKGRRRERLQELMLQGMFVVRGTTVARFGERPGDQAAATVCLMSFLAAFGVVLAVDSLLLAGAFMFGAIPAALYLPMQFRKTERIAVGATAAQFELALTIKAMRAARRKAIRYNHMVLSGQIEHLERLWSKAMWSLHTMESMLFEAAALEHTLERAKQLTTLQLVRQRKERIIAAVQRVQMQNAVIREQVSCLDANLDLMTVASVGTFMSIEELSRATDHISDVIVTTLDAITEAHQAG